MQRSNLRIAAAAIGCLALTSIAVLPAAAAGDPTGNISYGREYGPLIRAVMSEHHDGTGSTISVYGSAACTSSTSDVDISISALTKSNWNDQISAVQDFNQCDVNLFANSNFGGASTGYKNYAVRLYVGDSWNDRASSFRIS